MWMQNGRFLVNVEEFESEAETSHWSNLKVFMPFYRQSATWLRRHDALLRGLCSFGLTFSGDSVPPDALVCIFVV